MKKESCTFVNVILFLAGIVITIIVFFAAGATFPEKVVLTHYDSIQHELIEMNHEDSVRQIMTNSAIPVIPLQYPKEDQEKHLISYFEGKETLSDTAVIHKRAVYATSPNLQITYVHSQDSSLFYLWYVNYIMVGDKQVKQSDIIMNKLIK